MRKWTKYIRYGSLAIVLAAGAWLLWPPAEEAETDGVTAEMVDEKVDYYIKFSPGFQYMPGQIPFGIGEKLRGLADVINDFEKVYYESTGLNVKVDVVTVPGRREYLVTQLSSGQAPDIINVNVEDVWVDIQKGWYIPLDGFLEAPNRWIREKDDPSIPGYHQWWDLFRYQAISRGKAAPDDKNYCISFDMVETGLFYNKDIFHELGLSIPETFEQWMDDLATIQDAGYTPLLMNIWNVNDWAVDLVFDQLYYSVLPGIDLLKDPIREQYLEGYLDADEIAFLYQKGFFTESDARYLDLWRILLEFRQYFNRNLTSLDPVREFVTQQGAIIWQASNFVYRLQADPELEFDWGVFYLPRLTTRTSQFASGTEMCVIGGAGTQLEVTNTAIRDTDPALPFEERIKQSKRLEVVMDFFQFLMVPENYEQIVNEYPAFVPNVVGVEALPPLRVFEEILDRRYTTTKWDYTFDLRFSEIQRRMLELYLNGGTDLNGFMKWQTDNLDAAVENHLKRKEVPWDKMQKNWDELKALRVNYKGLPSHD
jgi:raffinose/stachyose/melibiose transport system substrate-binding protein